MRVRNYEALAESTDKKKRQGTISYRAIEEMYDAINILDVLETEYDLYFEKGTNGWWHTNCPMPNHDDNSPSFSVNEETGWYNCFGCLEKGRLLDFIQKVEGLSFPDAVARLSAISGVSMDMSESGERFRVLRDLKDTINDYLSRCAETDLPGGISETAFMRSVADRLRAHEAKVDHNPEEVAWVDEIYAKLDDMADAGDQKGMSKLWSSLGKTMRERVAAYREQQPIEETE